MPIDAAGIRAALAAPGGASSDFDLNPGLQDNPEPPLVDAAVLVALIDRPRGPHVILTERAADLAHHAGQIAFPGGRVAPEDAGPREAALRESHEEIGLRPDHAEILGQCHCHKTTTGFRIYPFVAAVSPDFQPVLQEDEVASLFEVPFAFLVDTGNFRIESAIWRGSRRRYYAVPYNSHFIWGATAAILFGLANRVKVNGAGDARFR